MEIFKIRNYVTGRIHQAYLRPEFKGQSYEFVCGGRCNLAYMSDSQGYGIVEPGAQVTCKKCLRKMEDD